MEAIKKITKAVSGLSVEAASDTWVSHPHLLGIPRLVMLGCSRRVFHMEQPEEEVNNFQTNMPLLDFTKIFGSFLI